MLDDENPTTETTAPQAGAEPGPEVPGGAGREANPGAGPDPDPAGAAADRPAPAAKKAGPRKSAKKSTRKKTTAADAGPTPESATAASAGETSATDAPEAGSADSTEGTENPEAPAKKAAKKAAKKTTTKKTATKKTAAKKTTAKKAASKSTAGAVTEAAEGRTEQQPGQDAGKDAGQSGGQADSGATESGPVAETELSAAAAPVPLFQPPKPVRAARKSTAKKKAAAPEEPLPEETAEPAEAEGSGERPAEDSGEGGGGRRRRRRGGRRRRRGGGDGDSQADEGQGEEDQSSAAESGSGRSGKKGDGDKQDAQDGQASESGSSRRRRRRRRSGDDAEPSSDEPQNTVTKVRKGRSAEDEITALTGSTRLEAKRQRRREGREAGRRRAPIVSEAEFLARREAVDRVMVMRQKQDLTQIAVLEDKVLVEHYVARESQTSLIGNVYLGRVQNVLPSMEAAFIDIGKGRNAVLYAGEVNWDALGGKDGNRKIEQVLKSGQPVLVQVTKDPIGHKGARLTSQIALPGRFLVYVPDGTTSGISRKLPDTERNRLKTLLKQIVPDSAGVIVRTAAEGASEDELTRDVERLTARWSDISAKAEKGNAPQLLYGEPDLTLKVVRDLFTEDFDKLVVSGDDAWDMVDGYVQHVAPDLADRLERWSDSDRDVFAEYRIDEQIAKGLDRKVWLPSGGSLIIDRTEAMTVIDVNTGKFTGSGGNLEETVTKNNLEAAEEIVRQLRLRDIGGIVVIDFIDMVLESNRDLVLRRLVECLGRDRTRHQVAEVTSLGLVQMTRKRIGTGLLEAFSESCEHCQGRGLLVHHEPVEQKKPEEDSKRGRRSGRGRGKDNQADERGKGQGNGTQGPPSPKDVAAMARPEQPRESEMGAVDSEPGAQGETTTAQPQDTAASRPQPQADSQPESQTESQTESQPEPQPVSPSESSTGSRPETEPAAAPELAAPKVVTRVRRRSSRPAGPPSAGASGTPSGHPEEGDHRRSDGDVAHLSGTDSPADEGADQGADQATADADHGAGSDASGGRVPVKTKTGRRR